MKKRFFSAPAFKKTFFIIASSFIVAGSFAQTTSQSLQKAFQQFEDDSQLKYAISSLYVIDAKTGKVVFDKNSRVGLAPASTQKIITSVTAFEILGKDFRYKTEYRVGKDLHFGNGWLSIKGSGDPTFGSWRYTSTKDSTILSKIFESLRNYAPPTLAILDGEFGEFGTSSLPDGYMWQDMGNYYGSGHFQLNWKENQYDISFSSGNQGELTKLVSIGMDTTGYIFRNEVRSGAPGSGDNAYAYSSPYSKEIYLRGTVPPNQKSFVISAANPDPPESFGRVLKSYLETRWKTVTSNKKTELVVLRNTGPLGTATFFGTPDSVYTHYSPTLDSIIYWFNKKSINLYGEALIKTMAVEKIGYATTDSGVAVVQRFWKEKGLDENELNIADGSGLSPINRVTTHAQVEILKYAKTKDWFPYFYNALPEYNAMKMKSGTIRDVKAFCGYQKAKDGNEYIFSFIVNNYNGPASMLVNKMYKVLDTLK